MTNHKEELIEAFKLLATYNREGEKNKAIGEALNHYLRIEDEMIKCRQFLGAEPNETLFGLLEMIIKSLPKLYP